MESVLGSSDFDLTLDPGYVYVPMTPELGTGLEVLAGPPLPNTSDGSDFDEAAFMSDQSMEEVSYADLVKENTRLLCQQHPRVAQAILLDVQKNAVRSGWCLLSRLKPTKAGGYIQVSAKGANKFAVLEELVLWAGGVFKEGGEDCSHLCGQPSCTLVGHILAEKSLANQQRKGCIVWIYCPHPQCRQGHEVILVCPHSPRCIKYCEEYTSMEDIIARGLCSDVGPEVRQRDQR